MSSKDLLSKIKKFSNIELNDYEDENDKRNGRKVFSAYSDCKLCKGTLHLYNGKPCDCKKHYIVSKRFKECNIGSGFVDVDLEFYINNFSDVDVFYQQGLLGKQQKSPLDIEYLTEYLELYTKTFDKRLSKDGRGFILSGGYGCGKSSATAWVIKELILNDFNAKSKRDYYFINTIDLLDIIKDTWDVESPTKYNSKKMIDKIKSVDLLVLDDLGAEYSKSTEWVITIFLKFIKSRVDNNLPTIITTNYDSDGLADKYSEESFNRLSSVLTEKFDMFVIDNNVDVRTNKRPNSLKMMRDELEE